MFEASETGKRGLRPFAALVLISAIGLYAKSALNPIQDGVQLALHLSDNQISIVQGIAATLPMVLLWAPLGRAIDTTSRTRLLQWLIVACLVGQLATSIAFGFASLCLARALVGCAAMAMVPVTYSLAADLVRPEYRGRANILISIGQTAGISAAFFAASWLLGFSKADSGWRLIMRTMTVPLAIALLATWMLREPRRISAAKGQPAMASIKELLTSHRIALPIIVGEVCAEISLGAMLVWSAPFLSRGWGMSIAEAGSAAGTALLIGGTMGAAAGGGLVDMLGGPGAVSRALRLLGLIASAMVVCSAGMLAKSPAIALMAYGLLFVLATASAIAALTTLTNAVPPHFRGTALSFWSTCAMVFGSALAPLAASLCAGLFSGPRAIVVGLALLCGVSSLASWFAFWMAQRELRAVTG